MYQDAAILMYDVSSPASLLSLQKWWNEFRERAPVREGEEEDFCVVVVGNKIDDVAGPSASKNGVAGEATAGNGNASKDGERGGIPKGQTKPTFSSTSTSATKGRWKVSEDEAASFLEKLIPRSSVPATPDGPNANSIPGRDHAGDTPQDGTFGDTPASSRQRRISLSLPLDGDATPQSDDDDHNGPIRFPARNEEPASPLQSPPSSPSRTRSKSISIAIRDKTPSRSPRHLSPHPRNSTRGLSPSHPRSRSAVRLSLGAGTGSIVGHGGARN